MKRIQLWLFGTQEQRISIIKPILFLSINSKSRNIKFLFAKNLLLIFLNRLLWLLHLFIMDNSSLTFSNMIPVKIFFENFISNFFAIDFLAFPPVKGMVCNADLLPTYILQLVININREYEQAINHTSCLENTFKGFNYRKKYKYFFLDHHNIKSNK